MERDVLFKTPGVQIVEWAAPPFAVSSQLGFQAGPPIVMQKHHVHGHVEINWLADGYMRYTFGGRLFDVPRRRFVLFWGGLPHRSIAVSPRDGQQPMLYNIYCPLELFLDRADLATLSKTLLDGVIVEATTDHADDESLLRRWHGDLTSGNIGRREQFEIEMMARLRRIVLDGWRELSVPAGRLNANYGRRAIEHVVNMMQFIIDNMTQRVTNADTAAAAGLHPGYAMTLFKGVTGMSIHRYLTRMRLRRACVLLAETQQPVLSIAAESGFGSVKPFYDAFNRTHQMTPKAWREAARRGEMLPTMDGTG